MTVYMSFMSFPWSIKIIYGLVSDNIPIFGFRRKSYIILMGLIQFCVNASLTFFEIKSAYVIAIMFGIMAFTIAFGNVVSDAIMIVQARRDPVNGSKNLVSLCWMFINIGGLVSYSVGGYTTQYFHPRYSIGIFCISSLSMVVVGFLLNPECEMNPD